MSQRSGVVIAACLAWHGTAGAQTLDLTIANFSNAMLELFEVQNGRAEIAFRVESGYSRAYKSTVGTAWRINWLLGREVCKFVTRARTTVVTIDAPAVPTGWKQETITGFQVMFSAALLRDDGASGRAREFIRDRLDELVRLVPPTALQYLRSVRLWLDLDAGKWAGAFYAMSPSKGYNGPNRVYGGFHGAMYLGAVFPNIVELIEMSRAWTNMAVLHELAHGYHHQVLGELNSEVKRTFEAAKAKGLYLNVSLRNGSIAKVGNAIGNEFEYFAVLTEAYFGRTYQTPLDAEELKRYDPDGFRLIERAWNGDLNSVAPVKIVACRSPD